MSDMHITHFVGRYLSCVPGTVSGTCVICGSQDDKANRKQDVISSSFTDWHNVKHEGSVVCRDCAACLSNTGLDGKALRSYSVIVTEKELHKASRKEISEAILTPPDGQYIILVNYSQKKHAFFSARINNPQTTTVAIGTDQGLVVIERELFAIAWEAALRLYWGGFSKADIDIGNTMKHNKIEEYGVDNYYSDMAKLNSLRNTKQMQLLIWMLYKDDQEEK